jgi:hypothetical protein
MYICIYIYIYVYMYVDTFNTKAWFTLTFLTHRLAKVLSKNGIHYDIKYYRYTIFIFPEKNVFTIITLAPGENVFAVTADVC